MFTSKVWTENSKLLEESNLTARQPRRVPRKSHLTNAAAYRGSYEAQTQVCQHHVPRCYHYSTVPTHASNTVLSNPRAACGPLADFKWPARVSLTFSNLCLKTEVTAKTWLNTWQFQHNSNPSDALNLCKVLKCTIRFRDSEASIPWFGEWSRHLHSLLRGGRKEMFTTLNVC